MKSFLEVYMKPDEEGNMLRLAIDTDLIMFIYEDGEGFSLIEIYRPKTNETELLSTGSAYATIIVDLGRLKEIEVS